MDELYMLAGSFEVWEIARDNLVATKFSVFLDSLPTSKKGPKALKLKFLISRGFSDGNNTFDSRCGLEKVDGEYKFTVGNGHKVWQGEIVIFPDFY